ncbi:heavy metal translocating P-type ATPase [Treponema medium]|uniref:P-type Cu(+) transporter n=2 Tax=Treponema medium TaxID=58231 RepID=A0AA87TE69_TREMD|nr:heavy metal translocating P-type ATPase [Treponema medium]EPF27930.1 heavy metal translocating P-type ATPase [Treponema medium ATCC 700293]QSH98161.1 heavy metal translocating P-type ATPase [Treponema medium]
MQTHYFTVTGMSCAACSANVEKAVGRLAGVETVQVNLLTKRMAVTYNPDTVTTHTIIQTIEKIGYGAFPLSEENTARPSVQQPDFEIADAEKKQFIFSLFFLIPLMYVSMGRMLKLPLPVFFAGAENALIFVFTQFLLTLPVLVLNRRFFINGLTSLFHRAPNMNSLIAVGSGAAVIYGVFALYRIGYGLGHGQLDVVRLYMKDVYFESSAMILTLISLGKFLEARAKKKTSEALEKLIQLRPETAQVLRNGTEIEIPVENIVVGDAIIIRPGQTLPVDGTIIDGSTSLDESAVTGESMPVEKTVGDSVISASHNISGSFIFRADKVGNDTTLARIIALVEEASSSKAPVAKLADVISGYFVPIVMLISLAAFIGWLIAGASFEFALSTAISVLVISCPCALGLATPTAIMAGTGKGAQLGILIRSAEGLELAHDVTAVLLDKTGTITEGKPTLQHIEVFSEQYTDNDILWIAYSLEHLSEHPLAYAIIMAAEEKKLSPFKVSDFMAIHGKGICGTAIVNELNGISLIENVRIGAGNTKLCKELGIPVSEAIYTRLAEAAEKGASPLLVIIGDECVGLIAVADPVKEGSIRAIHDFHEMGIHTVMLTGDNQRTAEAIQKIVGIGDVVAELLPQDKKAKVEYYRSKGFSPAFIGDGINDAPALTAADVGIAIGGGTDIAIESADIVLMNNSLETAVTAIQLSKAVMRTIKQNLFWALFYNSLCIPLAAGLFYTLFGLRLSPMFAAAAMSFSSVSVVSNALRLNGFRPKRIAQEAHNMQYCGAVPTGKKYDDAQPATCSVQTDACIRSAAEPESQTEVKSSAKPENITHKENIDMKNITLTVEGMSCGHCSARVEKALNAIEGVSAKVDLDAKAASVTYPDTVTIDALKAAVTDAGYSVTGSH